MDDIKYGNQCIIWYKIWISMYKMVYGCHKLWESMYKMVYG